MTQEEKIENWLHEQIESNIFSIICAKILTNPFPVNKLGETVFHISAKFCIKNILELAEHQSHCREVFLYNRDSSGNSPIHHWAMTSSKNDLGNIDDSMMIAEYGKMLIKMGALVNARNNQDQTPLHVVVSREAIACLLEHGAWSNVTSGFSGNTPLLTRVTSLDSSSFEVYETFNEDRSNRSDGRKEWQEIFAMGLNPWVTNNKGQSVLELLIRKRNFVLAKALISFFKDAAPLDTKHTNGKTILHILCSATANELQQVIDDLLKAGVTVNAMNSAKETPLHLVCRGISGISESVEDVYSMCFWIARRLLAYGADPSLQDSDGASCYDIAKSLPQLLELLKQPIDITAIPPLHRWSYPKSEAHQNAIAQVVRRQKSKQIECYHYHKEPIGSGGFGHVFAGVDERDGREVVVKRIEKHKLLHPRDRREIVNLVKLRNCEEVVRYLGHCEDADFVFLILDLMEGTLNEYLDKTSKDVSLSVSLCRDIVNGLQFLHEMSVLHRDLKPGNILYRISPKACFKIADFGLSSKATFNTTLQTSVTYAAAGTRCWMAPELLQATEEINHSKASDVFACGLVLHFFLAEKRHPFAKPSTIAKGAISEQNETERNIIDYRPFLDKDLPPEARHLMEKMLDENSVRRPRTSDILSHPHFWSEAKKIRFLEAVGNQPEVQQPRHKVTAPSSVEQDLENTLGNDLAVVDGWENSIPDVYLEMTGAGGRRYDTHSAVDLVRFVHNSYAHASDQNRTARFQNLLMKDFVFFKTFPSLLIEVFKAVIIHGWDKTRKEIESALKMD